MNVMIAHLRTLAGAAALAALGVSAPAVSAPPASVSAASDLGRAVEALRGISTLRADFVQTDRNGQSVTGKLTLKRPGRIRFEYEKSVPMLIVGDGTALTLVDYEVRQVQRWPIRNSPLGALLDPSRDVSRFGKLKPTASPNVISVEVRDARHPEYGVITLIFMRSSTAPGGLELVRWVALDSQNKLTTIQLANHRYGEPVADSAFKWKDPRPRVRR